MRFHRRNRGHGDDRERGAVLVITALFVTVAVMLAAIVLDLAQLRQDRASNRRTSDLVASAAATSLATPGGTGVLACTDAWEYFLTNTPNAGTVTTVPPCASTFSGACDPAVARTATGRVGRYTVKFTYPVPFGSTMLDRPDVVGGVTQTFNGNADGNACERIGVEVQETQRSMFGNITGTRNTTTASRTVARALSKFDQGGIIALLLLEQTSCDVLTASGQAQIIVEHNGDKPGYITADTSATGGSGSHACNNNNRWAIDAIGTQNSRIVAEGSTSSGLPGIIRMYALAPGQGNAKAYEPGDVAANRLSPAPLAASRRIGRNPIDWRWNCSSVGRDGIGGTTDDCRLGFPPYLNNLKTAIGTTGAPTGFQTYPRPGTPGDKCNLQPSDGAVVLPPGNWWINCPSGFKVANQVQFNSGNFVFQNGIEVGSSGSLTINVGNSGDGYIYLRNGDLTKDAQASIDFHRMFVYVDNGRVTMGAGTGQLNWEAPLAGNFEDLALWSESTQQHDLGGQAQLHIEGVFFTPNADPFVYTGQSGQEQRVNAQFVTRRMDVSGQGTLKLQPSPDRVATLPAWGAALIR
jgi:hypothetical protein